MTRAAPSLIGYAGIHPPAAKPRATFAIAACTSAVGIAVGIAQNLLNTVIAPHADFHFIGWDCLPRRWTAHLNLAIADGILSGLFLAAIFTVTTAAITGRRCDLKTGLRWFCVVVAADIAIWIFGGLCALVFSLMHPAWPMFPGFSVAGVASRLRVAWVCGALLGYELAGPVTMAGILVTFKKRWSSM
jgi:hypothetical protein